MHKENWDDLRFVLAVADQGSVSAAARVLGVNHATVLRRIAAFEDRHGGAVFDRNAQGYSVAPGQEPVIAAARGVEEAMLATERAIKGVQAPISGSVRVTSTDTFCLGVLPPVIAELQAQASGLRIDLVSSNARLDLARLHADVAVRPAVELTEELRGTVAARLGFAAYVAPALALPETPDHWLGLSGALTRSRPAQWLEAQVPPDRITASADSFQSLRELAAAGLGCAILPCILGDPDPRLIRLPHALPQPGIAVDIWVACHADLAEVPRIRAVKAFLIRALAQRAAALLGR